MAKNPKKADNFNTKFITKAVIVTSLLIIIPGMVLFFFRDRVYPGIFVADINLTGLRADQAEQKLNQVYTKRANRKFEFSYPQQASGSAREKFTIDLKSAGGQPDFDKLVEKAMSYGHKVVYLPPKHLSIETNLDSILNDQITAIAREVDIPAINSQLKFSAAEINVTPSQEGLVLDQQALKDSFQNYLSGGNPPPDTLPLKTVKPKIDYDSALRIKSRLDELKVSPLTLHYKTWQFSLDLPTILALIDLQKSDSRLASTTIFGEDELSISAIKIGNEQLMDAKLKFNDQALKHYLQTEIAPAINQPVEEPLFQFDGSRVVEFRPPQTGQQLDLDASARNLSQALSTAKQTDVNLAVTTTNPKNKLVNDMGITELLGEGVSHFSGSIENRIYNIGLAASKINGVLVVPDAEFSFDQTVGDITAATGYKQAYVIKSGRTVLDDGGGVCQVSTTLFRAILNAGLPITARTAHAYRVGYYEQGFPPGLDATIFYPSVDLKFKNDTGHYILIQSKVVGLSLYIDLYGTSDGRIAKISTPIVSSQTPPPAELRQDDPTLPKGTIKQVDWAAWGANVSFNRTVTRNGQTIIQETYRSNYRPWQAVYLVGTGG